MQVLLLTHDLTEYVAQVPWRAVSSYHTIPNHTIPYHTIPYHLAPKGHPVRANKKVAHGEYHNVVHIGAYISSEKHVGLYLQSITGT
jgi:hypothetical protein